MLKALSALTSAIGVLLFLTVAVTLFMREGLAQLGLGLLFTLIFVCVPMAIVSLGVLGYSVFRKRQLVQDTRNGSFRALVLMNSFSLLSVVLFAAFYESVRRFGHWWT